MRTSITYLYPLHLVYGDHLLPVRCYPLTIKNALSDRLVSILLAEKWLILVQLPALNRLKPRVLKALKA
jgi:hypothetical protein